MIKQRLYIKQLLSSGLFNKTTYYDDLRKRICHCKFDENPNLLLIIAGCSGSGKTTFEEKLIATHPIYFNKLPQITTREKRNDNDNGYYFVNKDVYDYMQDSLIARLKSFNENQYGTLPLFADNKINTVIASYDAINDLFDFINEEKLSVIPMILLFDIDNENISEDGRRKNRDSKFLEKERNELINVYNKYKDQCVYSAIYKYEDYGRFAEVEDIIEI